MATDNTPATGVLGLPYTEMGAIEQGLLAALVDRGYDRETVVEAAKAADFDLSGYWDVTFVPLIRDIASEIGLADYPDADADAEGDESGENGKDRENGEGEWSQRADCPSCGYRRPLANADGLFIPGSVCPECGHVEPENEEAVRGNGEVAATPGR